MSWLTGGLTQSVTGKLSQITGQFKDILSEGTEDVVDPDTELKVLNDKLKENEKRFELLKMESDRWQEESNELNLKCKTYEAQLEQRNNEYRSQLMQKDSQINELRKQISNLQESKTETSFDLSASNYQKSALMEEFEELMPSSDLNDYIHFQKEIKRLNEDNMHLSNENKQLLHKLKKFESNKSDDFGSEGYMSEQQKQEYEITIENLKQELFVLKERLNTDKDKHQEEIIAIQNNYASKVDKQLKEKQNEVEISRIKLEEIQAKLDEKQKELDEIKSNNSEPTASKISSNKSDDGWCLNGDEIHFESVEKIEIKNLKTKLNEKEIQLSKLQQQVDMFENDLEQANNLILRLKNMNKSKSPTPSKSSDQEELIQSMSLKHNEELQRLNQEIKDLNDKLSNLNETLTIQREKTEKQQKELEAQDKQIDSLTLELKQQQQNLQQEKIIQMQEQKQERQEMSKLKMENNELKLKLDEKLAEIKSLGDQINDLNTNINGLKSNDSVLFDELKRKTEEFMKQLDLSESEIAALKHEKEQLIEQRKQFEFVLDEKTRESSQLKNDIQKHLQHIGAQSKAIEKLQEELKLVESDTKNSKDTEETNKSTQEELSLLKQQYNEIYTYLEQKNQESLSYYNEIQRLNGALSNLTTELENAKSVNENLNEQYDNLMKECQMEQKIVEDLNQQIDELNKTFMNAHNIQQKQSRQSSRAHSPAPTKVTSDNESQTEIQVEPTITTVNKTDDELVVKKEESESEEKHQNEDIARVTEEYQSYKETQERYNQERQQYYENMITQIKKENQDLLDQMKLKLDETTNYYENIINEQNENFKQTILNEEQLQMNLSKQLSDLRNHLAEVTDNYNREMIQAEQREIQLRSDLNNLEEMLRKQNENIEISNRELDMYKSNNSKLDEMKSYYENKLAAEIEHYKQQLMNEEQQQIRLKKELERLREHLVEMSDSYNKDAIQAEEREKQLRLALNEAQQALQKQDVNIENSSKELEYKLESLNQINLDIKNEKDKLKEKLKQTEDNLNHQIKVTKNLELVLERLQNDKESLYSTEILKYQQTIKDQANSMHNLQKEAQTYQAQIENLKNSLDSANIFMEELEKKDEILKQFKAQIATKDALIESLDKRVNEIQKVNDSYIEKEMIKNLVIGYIKVNQQHEKKQVLKLISTMLSFSPKEIELVESAGESKWFTNLLKPTSTPTKQFGPGSSASSGTEGLNKSFTELLIQYVDRESKPKPNIQFDINDPNISHKKTDTTSLTGSSSKELANTSASAINFFNKTMVSQTGVNDSIADNLVNRNQQQQPLSSNNQTIPGVSSPAVANNFLEQILKS